MKEEDSDSTEEVLVKLDRRSSSGQAAAGASLVAPSSADAGLGGDLYTEDLGLFTGLLDAKSAQAECVRMLKDCSGTAEVDFAAFTIDRANIIQALKDCAMLGARVRVLVDLKNTVNLGVRDQTQLLGDLALPATKVQNH